MSLELILASGNPHKAEEFSQLFDPQVLSVKSAPEKLDVVEDGTTFHQNAFKKAEAYFQKFKTSVVADDSGLVVNALPGEMGIYSARFGGDNLSDKERAEELLKRLDGAEDRSAYFVCVLCFYLGPDEVYFFEGRMDGEVSSMYIGDHGFGYDPVFCPTHTEGKRTVAQIPDWKKENSHRAQACKFAGSFLRERNCQKPKDSI